MTGINIVNKEAINYYYAVLDVLQAHDDEDYWIHIANNDTLVSAYILLPTETKMVNSEMRMRYLFDCKPESNGELPIYNHLSISWTMRGWHNTGTLNFFTGI